MSTSSTEKVYRIHKSLSEILPEEEKFLPHACTTPAEYQTLVNHVTYTPEGKKVLVDQITGYYCVACGLVVLTEKVSDELYELIDLARNFSQN